MAPLTEQFTPNQVHRLLFVNQLLLFVHATPYVDAYSSTSAARSGRVQLRYWLEQFVMQFVDHDAEVAGNSAVNAAGSVPTIWFPAMVSEL